MRTKRIMKIQAKRGKKIAKRPLVTLSIILAMCAAVLFVSINYLPGMIYAVDSAIYDYWHPPTSKQDMFKGLAESKGWNKDVTGINPKTSAASSSIKRF